MNCSTSNGGDWSTYRFFPHIEQEQSDPNAKWWFSVLDIVALLTDQNDFTKTRNYWKYLKAKLKKGKSQVVSATTQLKLLAPDGKKRFSDMLDYTGIIALVSDYDQLAVEERQILLYLLDNEKITRKEVVIPPCPRRNKSKRTV